jgi:hypothetical protein
MTTAERAAISTSATGLMVYDTDEQSFFYWEGISWFRLGIPSDAEWNEFLKSDAAGQASW